MKKNRRDEDKKRKESRERVETTRGIEKKKTEE